MQRSTAFVTELRQTATELIGHFDDLQALRREWDALDYGDTLPADVFSGVHEGLTVEDLAAVFTSMDAFAALLAAGHATNFYKVRQ